MIKLLAVSWFIPCPIVQAVVMFALTFRLLRAKAIAKKVCREHREINSALRAAIEEAAAVVKEGRTT